MKWLAFACLALLVGCAEGPTQVVVTIDAESTFRDAPTDLRIVVRGADDGSEEFEAPARDVTIPVGPQQTYVFPIDVTVAPRDGDASRRWSVEAIATTTDDAHTATVRVRGSYVSGRTARVSLLIENACDRVSCDDDETCTGGVCTPIEDSMPANDAGVDGGFDAGTDASTDAGTDSGLPGRMCPGTTPYVANPAADTLGYGVPPTPAYPPLPPTCNNSHQSGQFCNPSVPAAGVCFREQLHGGQVSYCRTPCADLDVGTGITADQQVCRDIHPDSRCAYLQGDGDGDDYYCTFPCNPYDNVGCPAGTQCVAYEDTHGGAGNYSIVTDCVPVPTSPGYQDQPCADDGTNGVWPGGCAPGYVCRYDEICGGPQAPACVQLCDPAITGSKLSCPDGTVCHEASHVTRTIGPLDYAFCFDD